MFIKFDNLTKQYYTALQLMLSLTSLNLIYFISCSTAYFRFGIKTHLASLSVFSIGTIMILFAFGKFFKNPI